MIERVTDTIYIVDDSDDEQVEPMPLRKPAGRRVASVLDHSLVAAAPASTVEELDLLALPLIVSDRVETGQGLAECTPLAHCRDCHQPRDLLQFYEPAEGAGTIFVSCQPCRLSRALHEATAGLPLFSYECPCGSVLKPASRKGHEHSKKHKRWNKANAAHRRPDV